MHCTFCFWRFFLKIAWLWFVYFMQKYSNKCKKSWIISSSIIFGNMRIAKIEHFGKTCSTKYETSMLLFFFEIHVVHSEMCNLWSFEIFETLNHGNLETLKLWNFVWELGKPERIGFGVRLFFGGFNFNDDLLTH